MKENKLALLKKLEAELKELSVKIIYDNLKTIGGFCRLKDRYYLIINKNASIDDKINLLLENLNRLTKKLNS
ncbi:MAG: hypothetical protein ABIK73_02350 [candidate division WOR-3 bacterium]